MTLDKEFDRILELYEYDFDYNSLQDNLKDLAKLAAKVAGTKVSMINLIDHYTQWTVSHEGFDVLQMPKEESVCQHTIKSDEHLVIEDLTKDVRTSDKDYVINDPNLRFYYGIPLKTKSGHNLGALCMMDKESKKISPEDIEFLELIGKEVINRLASIKAMKDLEIKLNESNNITRKVGHDIRGPVSGIIGVADMIRKNVEDGNTDDILLLIDMVKKGSQSILDLADSILSENELFEEHVDDRRKKVSTDFTLKKLQTKIEELFIPQAVTKDIKLEVKCSEEFKDLAIQKNKLLQISGNLISNAIKFTPKEGKVTVELDALLDEQKKHLIIKVKDTGVGMSQEKIDAFLSGETESSNGTMGEEGYGFGLKLVQHLVEKMEGNMYLESSKKQGTTLKVELPIE